MSGGGPGRVSSITLNATPKGEQWTATNQGFGNPPATGALDAKVGASVLNAAESFLKTNPKEAFDPGYNSYENTVTIQNGDTKGTYGLEAPGADALREAVFAAANTVPY